MVVAVKGVEARAAVVEVVAVKVEVKVAAVFVEVAMVKVAVVKVEVVAVTVAAVVVNAELSTGTTTCCLKVCRARSWFLAEERPSGLPLAGGTC